MSFNYLLQQWLRLLFFAQTIHTLKIKLQTNKDNTKFRAQNKNWNSNAFIRNQQLNSKDDMQNGHHIERKKLETPKQKKEAQKWEIEN